MCLCPKATSKSSKFSSLQKVKLVSPHEVDKKHDGNTGINVKRVADRKNNPSDKLRCDARNYREWLKSDASKPKMSGSPGRLSVTSAEACKEIKEEVVESHSTCSKRQRVDINSTQKSSCNAEAGSTLHGVSPEQDGKELISEINIDWAEEYSSDVPDKESQLESKIGGQLDACSTCMLGGELLFCVGKGCKRNFHLSCLVPALNNYPPGVWHCILCVKKKKELGVHSVSEVESIWDARDAVSDNKAMQHEKQYLVKYRGLAHIHNRWIPEKKLLFEAPALITKYNSKNQVISWKKEWTVPHRLLQKRKLSFPTITDDNSLDCSYEWLVKWTGLGYDQATWELDNSLFLRSPEAMKLVRDFEIRHQKSQRFSSHSEEKEKDKCSVSDLSQLSFGGSPREYDHYRSYVNKLLTHWHKNQNAVVYDDQPDQERVVKVIFFILSLQVTARRPFLIISKSTALSIWESEFLRVASSANIIVYKGRKNVRSSIRSLEFHNESGSLMFDILLSSSDIVAEDCSADYQNMLSLLDSGYELDSDHSKTDSNTDVYKLKDIFALYTAFECKSGCSSFVEYWVPVQLSYLQLEQYCATLLSNSMFLSSLKSDSADALREVMISTRKCCDHPYLLDQSLQSVITKGLSAEENLDVGINASGKLQLLDKILTETKARGLRVLILFQSIGGTGRDSVGNIMDDFICQRFGKHSFVRIDAVGCARSKKKSFVNMFNNKESGRSFLLLEDRACLPSIKLSAVDIVILFDSDWEPQNDIKALHRISIGSQFEQLKVFRLYSSFTIEEKILIHAKEGKSVDSNIRTLNRNSCLRLLSWGASYLFDKLDDFHGCSKPVSVSNVSCEKSFLNAVFLELLAQLPCSGESNHSAKCSFITEAPQDAVYDGNNSLFGEKEIGSVNHELSMFSWQKMLEGRHPQWKFLSELSPRNRKKVNHLNNPPNKSELGEAVIKKRRMVINSTDDPKYPKWKLKGKRVANKKRKLAASSKDTCEKNHPCSTDGKKDLNQSNPLLLKLGISKLCEVLLLPENVRGTAVAFLEYIMQEYDVSCKSTSTSQAYQISLCWIAADLLKHKIDQNESLALAKLCLNLDCGEEEVEYIYSKLRSVVKTFAQCSETLKGYEKSKFSKSASVNPKHTVLKTIPSIPSCSQSGTVKSASSIDPDESLIGKTVSSSPTRMVAGHFGSDSEHGRTEEIVLEEVKATCDQQHHKVSSSSDQRNYNALTSDSPEHQSPLRPSAPESVPEPSEVPQVQSNAVVVGNDLMRRTNTTQANEESNETDPVTSERATVSKITHHDSAVTLLSGDSDALEFSGTGQSLEASINANESNSLLCQETVSLLLSVRPSSAESNISIIPASGIQHDVSSNLHVICQEAPVPGQASLEVLLDESSGAPVINSVTLLPQLSSASIPMAGSETHQWSTTTSLRPTKDLPSQVNTFRPVSVTPQPACSNPLQIELMKLQKLGEQALKQHEDMISQLKSERDKEVQEICKKYDMLLQDAEIAFTQKRQHFEIYCRQVYANNLLAETVTYNLDKKATWSPEYESFINQLVQQPTAMLDPRIEPSFTGLGAPPPPQTPNHSPTGVAVPPSAPAIHVAESNWVGSIRAPAPHLRALNPRSMLTPHTSALHGRMSNQQLAHNPETTNLNVSALHQELVNNQLTISPNLLPQGTPRLPTIT